MSRRTVRAARIPAFLWLLGLALLVLYPVYVLLITSTRTNSDYLKDPLGWPQEWTPQNFAVVWINYGAGQAFMNSLLVVSASLVITLTFAILAGYSLAKLNPPWARFFSRSFVSVMLIPSQVLILPIYLMLSRLEIVGTHVGLVLVYVATNLPFATFFMSVVFRGLPGEVIEAARVDGAGINRTLVSVALPMSTAGIATLAVLQFMAMWNELLFAYILLPQESMRLLTPALTRLADRYISEQPLIAAGLLIAACLPVLMLAFSSRFLVKGVSVGAIR